jgi:putative ABC transport system ATP-binding protein
VSAPLSAANAAGAKLAPAAAALAIDVRNLRFAYRAGRAVLDIPSLQVPRGEKVFLYGPSGSGKTTLLGLLAGVLTASAGEVRVLGAELGGLSGAQRDRFRAEHIGYIFQMFNLIPYLSVRENITLPCRLSRERRARLGGTSPDAAAAELTRRLEIAEWEHTPVTELSVGQQQRVAAARALIGAPELVIADEPTSALDAERRERFIELLFEQCAQAGSTLLFVSHDRQLAPLFDRELSLPELQGSGFGIRDSGGN